VKAELNNVIFVELGVSAILNDVVPTYVENKLVKLNVSKEEPTVYVERAQKMSKNNNNPKKPTLKQLKGELGRFWYNLDDSRNEEKTKPNLNATSNCCNGITIDNNDSIGSSVWPKNYVLKA